MIYLDSYSLWFFQRTLWDSNRLDIETGCLVVSFLEEPMIVPIPIYELRDHKVSCSVSYV